jgi:hypothetical protein
MQLSRLQLRMRSLAMDISTSFETSKVNRSSSSLRGAYETFHRMRSCGLAPPGV